MGSADQTVAPPSPYNAAGVGRGIPSYMPYTGPISHSDGRHTPKRPTPLQVSVTATAAVDYSLAQTHTKSPKSPMAFRSYSDPVQPSPRPVAAADRESPKSPAEQQLDPFPAAQDRQVTEEARRIEINQSRGSSMMMAPPKVQSYSPLRNLSSSLPDHRPLGHSSPPSPRLTASPPLIGSALHPEGRQTPRTSSIDSAISSMSAATTSSYKGSPDLAPTVSSDVSHYIKMAGSAEAAIQRLLREKQQTDARYAQLWSIAEKQRRLVLAQKKDLENTIKERERYRQQVKEYRESLPPIPARTSKSPVSHPRLASRSPAPSDSSADLPIQGNTPQPPSHASSPANDLTPRPRPVDGTEKTNDAAPAPVDVQESHDWANSKGKASRGGHSHKHTSSSDVGIFNVSKPTQDMPALHTQNLAQLTRPSTRDALTQVSPTSRPGMSPTSSFTAKRSQPHSAKSFNGPALTLTESTPTGNDFESMSPPRKAPPAPLDLAQPRKEPLSMRKDTIEDHSSSEYDEDDLQADDLPRMERGRKKTREDDDREREALLQRQQEERSRSKKDKSSNSRASSKKSKRHEKDTTLKSQQTLPMPPSIKALVPEPTTPLPSSFLSQPASLASMLNPSNAQNASNLMERSIPANPMSPGLPLSPRPSDRPVNAPTPRLPRDPAMSSVASPPLSPNTGFVGLPLSPRAPRQLVPHPPSTPMSIAPSSPMPTAAEVPEVPAQAATEPGSPIDEQTHSIAATADSGSVAAPAAREPSHSSRPKGIFKGFMSEAYPGLLIPPNALPSIIITVVSSRLKRSRHSLIPKGADDEPVFTLGVSARFNQQELWHVEKPILSLQHLDQQLRQSSKFDVKLPDRSLFSGHAPAKVDARRIGLENYFEAILDTPMDEKAAIALCKYLSTNVSDPTHGDATGVARPVSPASHPSSGQMIKEGYLTKRGKNFGGWKSRYFVLDDPVLLYYETPGGALLGKITLHRAQIGKQSPPKLSGSGDEGEGQYRHAFLIREPKRKDWNSYVDHVLCAESDAERDAWVNALMGHIRGSEADSKARPPLDKHSDSGPSKAVLTKKNSLRRNTSTRDSPDSDDRDSLQAVPYEETRPAQPPQVRIMPDPPSEESPSPTTPGSQPSDRGASVQSKGISAPQNGAKISDAGAWGNKPPLAPVTAPKEHKKRGLFGFHNRDTSQPGAHHPNSSDLSVSQQQYQEQITNVKAAFGAPLAEVVEYCAPHGAEDVCLPAVVYRSLQYLEAKNAASEEGIFRMSGSNTLIKNLKNKFNMEGDYDLLASGQWYDVHAVASLLKQYLRELPSTILTRELHMQFLSVLGPAAPNKSTAPKAAHSDAELKEKKRKLAAFNVLVHKLPMPNFHLLRALSSYLITVVNNSEVNKMDTRNIGIVFSPTLNIPTPVILMFINEFESIFGAPSDDANVEAVEVHASQKLAPEDIRSPRQQMFSSIPTPSHHQTSFGGTLQGPRQHSMTNGLPAEKDIGFVPLQPAYENTPMSMPDQQTQEPGTGTLSGPEYGVARPRNLAPGSSAKQSRRESSMLLMGVGQRKGSFSMMRDGEDATHEKSEFA
ncbi:MAG: hypothetical protein Q9163_000046 [Psora crenata]